MPKENRQRAVQIHFRVSEKERNLIYLKMEQAGIHDTNAYLRKMAIDGYVVCADMSDVKELVAQTSTRLPTAPMKRIVCTPRTWPTWSTITACCWTV